MLSSIDKLKIVLSACAILVALDFISEGCSIIVTYDSDKCYVHTNPTKILIDGLFLNLIIFALYGLAALCIKLYLFLSGDSFSSPLLVGLREERYYYC